MSAYETADDYWVTRQPNDWQTQGLIQNLKFTIHNYKVARSRRKKKKKIKFEVTIGGLLGIGVVLFCIFLWMFLLGIWAGQTILLPAG